MQKYFLAYSETAHKAIFEPLRGEALPLSQILTTEEVRLNFTSYITIRHGHLLRSQAFVADIINELAAELKQNKIVKKLVFDFHLFDKLNTDEVKYLALVLLDAIKQNVTLRRVEFSAEVGYVPAASATLVFAQDQRTYFHASLLYRAFRISDEFSVNDFGIFKKLLTENRILFNGTFGKENFQWHYNSSDPQIDEKMSKIAEGIAVNQDIQIIQQEANKTYEGDDEKYTPLAAQPSLVRLIQQTQRLQLQVSCDYLTQSTDYELSSFSLNHRVIINYCFNSIKVTPELIQLIANNTVQFSHGHLGLDLGEEKHQQDHRPLFEALAANTSVSRLEIRRKEKLLHENKLGESLVKNGRLTHFSFSGDYLNPHAEHDLDLAEIVKANPLLKSFNILGALPAQDKNAKGLFKKIGAHPSLSTVFVTVVDTNNSCYDRIDSMLENNRHLSNVTVQIIHQENSKCMTPKDIKRLKKKLHNEQSDEEKMWPIYVTEEPEKNMTTLTIQLPHRDFRASRAQTVWAQASMAISSLRTDPTQAVDDKFSPLNNLPKIMELSGTQMSRPPSDLWWLELPPQTFQAKLSAFKGCLFAKSFTPKPKKHKPVAQPPIQLRLK